MSKYNIELAHIYVDEDFGDKQKESIRIFNNKVRKKINDFVSVVLVDDYNPKTNFLDIEKMIKCVKEEGLNLDFVVMESALALYCQKIVELIPKEYLKLEQFGKRKVLLLKYNGKTIGLKDKSGKYSCSLMIAAWILCRLGYFKMNKFFFKSKGKIFSAERVINILDKKYYSSEMKVLDILRAAGLGNLLNNVEYVWY